MVTDGEDADPAFGKRLVEFDRRARSFRANRPADHAALPPGHVARFQRQIEFLNGMIADIG